LLFSLQKKVDIQRGIQYDIPQVIDHTNGTMDMAALDVSNFFMYPVLSISDNYPEISNVIILGTGSAYKLEGKITYKVGAGLTHVQRLLRYQVRG